MNIPETFSALLLALIIKDFYDIFIGKYVKEIFKKYTIVIKKGVEKHGK